MTVKQSFEPAPRSGAHAPLLIHPTSKKRASCKVLASGSRPIEKVKVAHSGSDEGPLSWSRRAKAAGLAPGVDYRFW